MRHLPKFAPDINALAARADGPRDHFIATAGAQAFARGAPDQKAKLGAGRNASIVAARVSNSVRRLIPAPDFSISAAS